LHKLTILLVGDGADTHRTFFIDKVLLNMTNVIWKLIDGKSRYISFTNNVICWTFKFVANGNFVSRDFIVSRYKI
jgi:hypothetical protein